jgi:purine-nucleoside phosphorylase
LRVAEDTVLRRLGPGDDEAADVAAAVWERTQIRPAAGIVLGSGLAAAVDELEPAATFDYAELPHLPSPTVPGHPGRLAIGELAGVPVVAFLGRFHYYEGYPLSSSTLPARVASALGAETMVLTAAVGAIEEAVRAGTLVICRDHLNLLGDNPLRGWRLPDGQPPFLEMAGAYDPELARLAESSAERLGAAWERGVYASLPGPTYETPAEAEMLRRNGATVVGMSVVPETIAARALDMRVLGLFAATNAVGRAVEHEDVIRVSSQVGRTIGAVLAEVLPQL